MNQKLKLKVTVFASGASVMVVEIIASRFFAPYFGNSVFVWSALIAVVLASLSLGYYLGGRLADRKPTTGRLSLILLASAISVTAIPVFGDIILILARAFLDVKLGSIVGSTILLSVPGVLLGMVSPYAIKLLAKDLKSLGSTAGDLYATSTIGSIFGTLLSGFVLIPLLGVSTIFFTIAALLCGLSLVLSPNLRRNDKSAVMGVSLLLLAVFPEPIFTEHEILHVQYTPYNRIVVEDDGPTTYLKLDGRLSGAIDKQSTHSHYGYIHYYELPFLVKEDIGKVLMVGGGIASAPRQITANHPETHVTIYEIDPEVTEVSEKYFYYCDDDSMHTVNGDARLLVQESGRIYDYVAVDVFNDLSTIPYHLSTKEFFHDLARITSDDGLIMMNIIARPKGRGSMVLKSIVKTVSTSFPHVAVYETDEPEMLQNVMVMASKSSLPSTEKLKSMVGDTKVLNSERIGEMLESRAFPAYDFSAGVILSDQYNPIESMYLELV